MKIPGFLRTWLGAVTLLSVAGVPGTHLLAAPGDLDLSCDPGSGINGPVRAVVIQPDRKLRLSLLGPGIYG
jgi:hypothetical protein